MRRILPFIEIEKEREKLSQITEKQFLGQSSRIKNAIYSMVNAIFTSKILPSEKKIDIIRVYVM